jgi:serine/threonine protein kinase
MRSLLSTELCVFFPVASSGSIAHLAPEVLQHGTCTKAADVYSFGVLIFMVSPYISCGIKLLLVV